MRKVKMEQLVEAVEKLNVYLPCAISTIDNDGEVLSFESLVAAFHEAIAEVPNAVLPGKIPFPEDKFFIMRIYNDCVDDEVDKKKKRYPRKKKAPKPKE